MKLTNFLSEKEYFKLMSLLKEGHRYTIIKRHFSHKSEVQKILIREFVRETLRGYSRYKLMGHKNESYMTEEEMLADPPIYTWEGLSSKEKMFYHYTSFHYEFSRNKQHASALLSGKFRQGLYNKNLEEPVRSTQSSFRMGKTRKNFAIAS